MTDTNQHDDPAPRPAGGRTTTAGAPVPPEIAAEADVYAEQGGCDDVVIDELDSDIAGVRRFIVRCALEERGVTRLAVTRPDLDDVTLERATGYIPAGHVAVVLDADEVVDLLYALAGAARRNRRHTQGDAGDPDRRQRFLRIQALAEKLVEATE